MSALKGILSESKGQHLEVKKKIEEKLANLTRGSVKERIISGKKYFYLQSRIAKKIVHKYLGRKKPGEILHQLQERKKFKVELKKVKEALKLLRRAEGFENYAGKNATA